MLKKQKTILLFLNILIFGFIVFIPLCFAGNIEFELQRPFGGLEKTMTIGNESLGKYINEVYQFGAAVIVGLAVVAVIVSGIQWILAGGVPDKIGKAKERMLYAFGGLFVALFAVFILRTINPETVQFASLDPPEIKGQKCCEFPDGHVEAIDEDKIKTECTDKGGKAVDCSVKPPKPVAPKTTKPLCANADPPFSYCKLGICDSATEDTITDAVCTTPGKPTCCTPKNKTIKTCDASNASTVCEAHQYCQADSVSATTGKCVAKEDNGSFCPPKSILGGGEDDICESGWCRDSLRATKATNVCSPTGGQGQCATDPGDFTGGDGCTHKNQCVCKLCYDWNEDPGGDDAANKDGLGICIEPTVMLDGWKFEDTVIDGLYDDMPCPPGLVKEKCGMGCLGWCKKP